MTIAYWIIAGLLALANLAAGSLKLVRAKAQLAQMGQGWVDDFPAWAVKLIGVAEVLGAIGLIVPPLVPGAPHLLAPIAAVCIAVLQLGALVVHLRRGEKPIPNAVLIALAVAAAVVGFLVWG